jgi:hypothetical protein
LRREQQFVCGAAFGRIAARAEAGDPLRLNAIRARDLQHVLDAVRVLADSTFEPSAKGEPIFEDIKRRLAVTLASDTRDRLASAAARLKGESLDGASLQHAMSAAAARAGLFAAADPAVAIEGFTSYARMFNGRSEPGLRGMPAPPTSALPFAVSAEHLAMRRRLGLSVSS